MNPKRGGRKVEVKSLTMHETGPVVATEKFRACLS
jgi:hypothetical protein